MNAFMLMRPPSPTPTLRPPPSPPSIAPRSTHNNDVVRDGGAIRHWRQSKQVPRKCLRGARSDVGGRQLAQ